jgi:hypothetical protein
MYVTAPYTSPNHAFGVMASLFIYRIDDAGDFHLVTSAETAEQALAEAQREHAKHPCEEYRVINPNIGVVEVFPRRTANA